MLIGYARVSKADDSQSTALQRDALIEAGVEPARIYEEAASGARADRPALAACLKAARPGDTLVVWKLDRLARSLRQLVNTAETLAAAGVELRLLTGSVKFDTTDPTARFTFHILAALAEFERELISERTRAGLKAARKRGRKGGRKAVPLPAVLAAAEMMRDQTAQPVVVAKTVGFSISTLYRYVTPQGELTRVAQQRLQAEAASRKSDKRKAA